jgi:hypothetical protein
MSGADQNDFSGAVGPDAAGRRQRGKRARLRFVLGLGASVLIDASVIRLIIVPATMFLLGLLKLVDATLA